MIVDNLEIKRKMAEKDLTKASLARKMKVADMTLIRKLNGKTKWFFDEVWQLTQILDVEMNDLLKKEEV